MDSRKYQLFKTEMCRNWQEMGQCRYAKKCRFAHGQDELKCIQRHARYKTEICKTFHLTGTCLYGVRCTFIHDEPSKDPVPKKDLFFNHPIRLKEEDNFFNSTFFTTPLHQQDFLFTPLLQRKTSSIWSSAFDRRYSASSSSSSSTTSASSSHVEFLI